MEYVIFYYVFKLLFQRVTGPDLAQLLIEDNRSDEHVPYAGHKSPLIAQNSANEEGNDLVECTNLLLRGCVDVGLIRCLALSAYLGSN
jgi:hypothetical protein